MVLDSHLDGSVVAFTHPVDQVTAVGRRTMAERVVSHLHTPDHK